jgi:hypothetical protein
LFDLGHHTPTLEGSVEPHDVQPLSRSRGRDPYDSSH